MLYSLHNQKLRHRYLSPHLGVYRKTPEFSLYPPNTGGVPELAEDSAFHLDLGVYRNTIISKDFVLERKTKVMANLKLASTDVSFLIGNFPNEQMRILRVISDYHEMTVRTNGLKSKNPFYFSQLFGFHPSFREVVIFY